MSTRAKAQPAKAAAKRAPKQPAKVEAPKGRQPVTSDAEITKWVKAELAKAAKRDEQLSTAVLLRSWREQGGKANPRRFAGLVTAAR